MTSCVCCGASRATPLYAGLLRCDTCTHVWWQGDVAGDVLERLYSARYFAGGEYADYVADRSLMERNFADRLATLKQFRDPSRHTRLLEIGCAYGFFLNQARSLFATVEGIDISEAATRYARDELKLSVTRGDLGSGILPPREFDVICAWDTLEHLPRPDLSLEAAGKRLARGGLLALTTGDIGSLNARVRRSKWRLIHPPTHLHYFTRLSLTHLLTRIGFDVAYVGYCGFHRSIGAIVSAVLKAQPEPGRLWRWLARRPVYLNLFDIMCVIAVKRI